jgi:hypothetical protein
LSIVHQGYIVRGKEKGKYFVLGQEPEKKDNKTTCCGSKTGILNFLSLLM